VGVSPDFMGVQEITVVSAYRINGVIERHIDTLSVIVRTNATLVNFEVNPEVKELDKGIPFKPAYSATYSTFIANIPSNDANLSVVVDNPNIVSYNLSNRYFIGIDTGSTFATITYRGLKDTIYFSVADTASITTSTQGIGNDVYNQKLDVNIYPNPTTGQLWIQLKGVETARIQVINAVGQVVRVQEVAQSLDVLDLSAVPNGVYYLTVTADKGRSVQKVVIQH
jgi:hypothetical protein